jgi:membrane protein DedA with SNARE-associated domain
MGALVWIMAGLAVWHFTVWLPDHFAGGIVGAFLAALIGSFVFGLIVNAGSIPGQSDTHLLTGLEALPGAVIGLAIDYWLGLRNERRHPEHLPA